MTIKAKLLLSTVIEIVLIAVASLYLFNTSNQINRATKNEAQANQIVKSITLIRFSTFENLFRNNERSYEQWQIEQSHLVSLLTPQAWHSSAERQLLNNIAVNNQDSVQIFKRLNTANSAKGTNIGTPLSMDFQQRMGTQLLVKQQKQIDDAFKYSTISGNEAAALRHRSNMLIVTVVGIMFMIMIVNFWYVAGTIGNALKLFQAGSEKITSGDFGHRLKNSSRTDELVSMTTAFNSMAAALQRDNKAKTDFILIASHQLRTPLTAIKWSTEELIESKFATTKTQREHYLSRIYNSNERMIKLVDALLNVAKIDSGSLKHSPSPTEFPKVLDEVLADLAPQMHLKKITLAKDLGVNLPPINIDPTWLRVILQNLLSNAFKYSHSGQSVTVSANKQEDSILISIKDSGYGIPHNQKNEIFNKLFRAYNALELESEGNGVGLYITKAMVDGAGGTIWFESSQNQGTTFYVKLSTHST